MLKHLFALASFCMAFTLSISAAVLRAVKWTFDIFAVSAAAILRFRLPGLGAFASPLTPAYAGSPYDLRHEAGTVQRSAARNI